MNANMRVEVTPQGQILVIIQNINRPEDKIDVFFTKVQAKDASEAFLTAIRMVKKIEEEKGI